MKTKTFTAAVALTSFLTLGGAVVAAEGPHDAYDRALGGKVFSQTSNNSGETMGKAAYGTPTDKSVWSGHEAYDRAFLGIEPRKQEDVTMGKAAYGSSYSSFDGHAGYRKAFYGD